MTTMNAEAAFREERRRRDASSAAAAAHARAAHGYDRVVTLEMRSLADRHLVLLQASFMSNEGCRFAVAVDPDTLDVLDDEMSEEDYRARAR